jgi:hypothetical protein
MDEGSVHGSELAGPGCDRGELKYAWDKGNMRYSANAGRQPGGTSIADAREALPRCGIKVSFR